MTTTTTRTATITAIRFHEVVTSAGVRRVATVTLHDGTELTTIPGSPNGAAALSPSMKGGVYLIRERAGLLVSVEDY